MTIFPGEMLPSNPEFRPLVEIGPQKDGCENKQRDLRYGNAIAPIRSYLLQMGFSCLRIRTSSGITINNKAHKNCVD